MNIARWMWPATIVCLLICSQPARAENTPRTLHNILPAGGFAGVEADDLATLIDRVQHSEAWQSWLDSPVFQGWSIRLEGFTVLAVIKYFEDNYGRDAWTLAKMVAGRRMALALYPPAGTQPADYVLLIEAASAEDLAYLRDKAKPLVSAPGENITPSDRPDGGWQLRQDDGITTVLIDRWTVSSNNLSLLELTIDRCKSPAGNSLADEPARLTCLAHLGADHLAFGWANLAWFKQESGQARFAPQQREQPFDSLLSAGWAELAEESAAMGFALDVSTRDLLLTTTLTGNPAQLPAAYAGFFPHSNRRSLELPNQLARIDVDRDLAKWYAERKTLLTSDGLAACAQLETMFRALLQAKDFEKDLLPTLGTHWTFVVSPQTFAHLPGRPEPELPATALVGELRDVERGAEMLRLMFETGITLSNLQAGQEGRAVLKVGTENYRGQTLVAALRTSSKEPPLTVADNVTPAFAVVGDRFFLATSTDLGRTLIDALLAESGEEDGSSPFAMEFSPAVAADLIHANRELLLAQMVKDGKWHWQGERELDWLRAAVKRVEPIRFQTLIKPDHVRFDWTARWNTD